MFTGAPSDEGERCFATTRWTVVLGAASTRAPGAREAMAELCRRYWKPLYGFARARGLSPELAQDRTQDFFVYFIEHQVIAHADRNRGRFRTFLLACLQNFLHSAGRKESAYKRGGGFEFVALDVTTLEEAEQLHQTLRCDAEDAFDAQWALAVFDRSLNRLRDEAVARERAHFFDELRPFLAGEGEACGPDSYHAVAGRLGVSLPMVKSAINRLRERFRTTLREEVAVTLAEPDEVDDEMRHLRAVLARTLGRRGD